MKKFTPEGYYIPTEEELIRNKKRREAIRKAKREEYITDDYVINAKIDNLLYGKRKNAFKALRSTKK